MGLFQIERKSHISDRIFILDFKSIPKYHPVPFLDWQLESLEYEPSPSQKELIDTADIADFIV